MTSKIPVFGVRADLLKSLMADPEWRAKLEKAQTNHERREVIFAFVKSKGHRIRSVDTERPR